MLIALFISISVFAQQGINYKAVIKDNQGNVLANELIDEVQFTITTGISAVYQETHAPTTDDNGIIIVNIGEGTPTAGSFDAIDWANGAHFLNVQINTGNGLTDMGTSQFMAVPYALSAANAPKNIDDLSDGKSDTGGSSLFMGIDAGLNDDGTDNKNTSIGFNTLNLNTTGINNTAVGYEALKNNTSGGNTAIGFEALRVNSTGFGNTAIGSESLNFNISGEKNTAIGRDALQRNTSGIENTAIGEDAMNDNTTGDYNTAIGQESMDKNSSGNRNIAIGRQALRSNTIGAGNIAIGINAGTGNVTGSGNIFIGSSTGSGTSTSSKLFLGPKFNNIPYLYGDFDTRLLRLNGTFEVNDDINVAGTLNVSEEINREATGDANMVPIAYGTISSTGSILSGTGNFTVDATNAPTFYINVAGSSLSHTNSSASVVPLSGQFRTASITHSNGDLRVYIFNSRGTQVANTFQFIIYKL